MKILKVGLQVFAVVLPRHAVHPGGGLRVQRPVSRPQALDIDVVKERGEPHILVLLCNSAHTIQITGHAQSGTASGTCFTGRVPLGQAPSLHHLRPRFPGLVRRLHR